MPCIIVEMGASCPAVDTRTDWTLKIAVELQEKKWENLNFVGGAFQCHQACSNGPGA
jgi:hypothetical protein